MTPEGGKGKNMTNRKHIEASHHLFGYTMHVVDQYYFQPQPYIPRIKFNLTCCCSSIYCTNIVWFFVAIIKLFVIGLSVHLFLK